MRVVEKNRPIIAAGGSPSEFTGQGKANVNGHTPA